MVASLFPSLLLEAFICSQIRVDKLRKLGEAVVLEHINSITKWDQPGLYVPPGSVWGQCCPQAFRSHSFNNGKENARKITIHDE
jgi:hypothetical protein